MLFVAEDRELLHSDTDKPAAPARLSGLLLHRPATPTGRRPAPADAHTDLWDAHQIVTDALAGHGLPALGLSGLGASLFSRDFLGILDGARLPNRALLAAVKALSQINDPQTGAPAPRRLPQPRQRRIRRHVRGPARLHPPLRRRRPDLHP